MFPVVSLNSQDPMSQVHVLAQSFPAETLAGNYHVLVLIYILLEKIFYSSVILILQERWSIFFCIDNIQRIKINCFNGLTLNSSQYTI